MERAPKNKKELVNHATSYMAIKIIFIKVYITWYIFTICWIKRKASLYMVNSHIKMFTFII